MPIDWSHWSSSAVAIYAWTWVPRVGGAFLVLFGFWLLAMIVSALLRRISRRQFLREKTDLLELLAQVARVAILIFGLVSALGTLGVNTSALVAGLGLTGFALGFALKDALSNVLAGTMILFYRPFQRGDRITVTGLEGTVSQIDLRYTSLVAGGKRTLVPNSTLLTNAIVVHEEAGSPEAGLAPNGDS